MPAFTDAVSLGSALDALSAAGISLFDQGNRLLEVRFSGGAPIRTEALLPHRLHGEEGLSENYVYTLDCLSPDIHLELKHLLGLSAEIRLRLPDGGHRLLTGLVTRAEQNGADGGFARYTLTLEPALATLVHRRNSRVFQDRSVPDIVTAILDEHLVSNPAFTGGFHYRNRLRHDYPVRSYCLQYRESDLAFIQRLLAEEGITYHYTHGPDPDTSLRPSSGLDPRRDDRDIDDAPPQHTLHLTDHNDSLPAARPDSDADSDNTLRYHRTDGSDTEDALDGWQAARQLQSGTTHLASYDYQSVATHTGNTPSRTDQGQNGNPLSAGLEDYDPQSAYYGRDPREIERYAHLRQQANDLACKTFSAEGSARHLVPGTWFELQDHPIHDQDNPEDRQFLVIRHTFDAENNLRADLPPDARQCLGRRLTPAPHQSSHPPNTAAHQASPPYRHRIDAIRRHIPFVPAYTGTAHQKPTARGLTTATVVGPEGEEIHTDAHGRIKIQFHWQRPGDHPDGTADKNERSSTWVRVALPSAGAAWGSQYIPRIGQEVVIDFLEGDIDRPLITGVVYNGTHRPPTFSGAGSLPANKSLSGHKSKEVNGERYNELLFDDSTGEIRTKLSSEHGKTQLNQGYLIHPRSDGQGTPRGEGFELRTDGHGALRAAHGLLLTTEAQHGAGGKQIARDHALAQADAALSLTQSLAQVATQQHADTLEHGPDKISADNAKEGTTHSGHLQHHLTAINAWEAGTNTDKEATTQSDEAGRQPIMILSAPAGIAALTGQALSLSAGTNLDHTAQRDTNQTSGRRWLHNVGRHISLFVNGVKDKISLKLIAAQGNVQMQAQHGGIEVTAEKDITVTACKGKVTMVAKDEILLTSGGGYIRIKDGNIDIHCPATASLKAAKHPWTGPDSMIVAVPQMPGATTRYDEQFQALDLAGTAPITNMPFRVTLSDGRVVSGVTDEEGKTPRIYGSSAQRVEVAWGGLQEGLIEEGCDLCDDCC